MRVITCCGMRLDKEFLLFAEPGVSSSQTQKAPVGPYNCAEFSPSSEYVLVLKYLHNAFPEAIGAISLLWYVDTDCCYTYGP